MASVGISDPMEEGSVSPPPSAPFEKKTWDELRQAVRKSRKGATSLLNRVPHSFTFRKAKTQFGEQTRLYFLGVPVGSRENTLLYTDLPSEPQPPGEDELEWRPLLDSFHATPLHGKFSKEEQLLRERKRVGSFGITSYDYCGDTGSFVFSACNSLFVCKDTVGKEGFLDWRLFPIEVKSSCLGSRLDPKFCPKDPKLLAFISESDLWVTNVTSGHEQRLTFTHKGLKSLADDPKSAGVPSFVVQEEFDRYTGYWWQPRPCGNQADAVYRILYEEVDESDVEILNIVSASSECGYDEYRYPRAGTPNAKCNLKIVEFRLDEMGKPVDLVDRQLCEPLQSLFPWMEYLLRAGWTPEGNFVYAQLLDRTQNKMQMVLIPLDSFISSECATDDEKIKDLSHTHSSALGTDIQIIYEETSDIWINVQDILHFLPQESPDRISFIWTSEKSEYRHLYLVTSCLHPPLRETPDSDMEMLDKHLGSLHPVVEREVMLTSGQWEVSGKQVKGETQIWVDEAHKLVYFVGLMDLALETHLYVVSYENPGHVVRLTELGYSHCVSLDKDCEMFVTVRSSVQHPPSSQVFRIALIEDGQIVPQAVGALLPQISVSEDYIAPEWFTYHAVGGDCRMYGMVYKPCGAQPGQKCPTVLFVYGGPQVQLVNNSYKGIRYLRLQTLATLGYAVVVIDSRGSCHRGLQFEGHLKNKLGTVEIADQVEGLQWVASQVDFIDLDRVAVHGWSYGGYLSLMGLVQRPDVFKVAVAGAPVTSWNFYDTGYTERYLNQPHNNQAGYRLGSVLSYIDKFPSQENRLLIVHGLIDENVHFNHTSALVTALVKACKPYQLQVYPNERHGIRNPEANEHYETMLLSFLQQNL